MMAAARRRKLPARAEPAPAKLAPDHPPRPKVPRVGPGGSVGWDDDRQRWVVSLTATGTAWAAQWAGLAEYCCDRWFHRVPPAWREELLQEARYAVYEAATRYDPAFGLPRGRGRRPPRVEFFRPPEGGKWVTHVNGSPAPVQFQTYATKWVWGRLMAFVERLEDTQKGRPATYTRSNLPGDVDPAYAEPAAPPPDGHREAAAAAAACLGRLDGRDREFVVLRYGLDGRGERTLQQIGTLHGLSKERVRTVIDAALAKVARAGNPGGADA